MSGGSGTEETTTTESQLSDELRGSSTQALMGAENLYNRGTEGIYQGTRLADQDALVGASQEQLMSLYGEGGELGDLVSTGRSQLQNYLTAGDLENNPLFQRQMESILDQANVSFQRGAVPLMQQASAAGQFGGSEGQEGLGMLGGEINRNTQQALINAAEGQQRLGMQAQGLLPSALQMGERGANVLGAIGDQRSALAQRQLLDEIQMYEGARNAELRNLSDFYAFLGANPLVGESSQTATRTVSASSDPFSQAIGTALAIAGLPTGEGSSVGGDFFGGG